MDVTDTEILACTLGGSFIVGFLATQLDVPPTFRGTLVIFAVGVILLAVGIYGMLTN